MKAEGLTGEDKTERRNSGKVMRTQYLKSPGEDELN